MRRKPSGLFFPCAALALVTLIAACARGSQPPAAGHAASIPLTSAAFSPGAPIPKKYTCDGANVSPPLQWARPPQGAKSLALICDDPGAPSGTFTHWVLYDLPPTATKLPEGIRAQGTAAGGARQGRNDFQKLGYGGPCPPRGSAHHYHFQLYALSAKVGLKAGATKAEVTRAMAGHILGEGRLIGTYQRR
jgi:Raf kinase inhibitor-like YbhB/YbcL family protein